MLWLGSAQYTQAVAKAHTRMALWQTAWTFSDRVVPIPAGAQNEDAMAPLLPVVPLPAELGPKTQSLNKPGREICLFFNWSWSS